MTTDTWTDTPGVWTNLQIAKALADAILSDDADDKPLKYAVFDAERICRQMRDEMAAQLAAAQQRIAELEAQTRWVPVPSGKMFGVGNNRIWTYGNGAGLTIVGSFPSAMERVELEDDVRLMRRRQAQEGAEG